VCSIVHFRASTSLIGNVAACGCRVSPLDTPRGHSCTAPDILSVAACLRHPFRPLLTRSCHCPAHAPITPTPLPHFCLAHAPVTPLSRLQYIGAIIDIHDQRTLQQQVMDERTLLLTVVDQLPVGVCVSHPTGPLRLLNRRFHEIWSPTFASDDAFKAAGDGASLTDGFPGFTGEGCVGCAASCVGRGLCGRRCGAVGVSASERPKRGRAATKLQPNSNPSIAASRCPARCSSSSFLVAFHSRFPVRRLSVPLPCPQASTSTAGPTRLPSGRWRALCATA